MGGWWMEEWMGGWMDEYMNRLSCTNYSVSHKCSCFWTRFLGRTPKRWKSGNHKCPQR